MIVRGLRPGCRTVAWIPETGRARSRSRPPTWTWIVFGPGRAGSRAAWTTRSSTRSVVSALLPGPGEEGAGIAAGAVAPRPAAPQIATIMVAISAGTDQEIGAA